MFEPYCWSSIWKSSDWGILSSDRSDIKLFFCLLKLKEQKAGPNCGGTLRLISLSAAAHLRPLFSVRVILFIAFFLLEKKTQQMMFRTFSKKLLPVRLTGYSGSGLSFSGLSPVKLPAGLTLATLRNSLRRESQLLLPGEMKVRKRNQTDF